MERLADKLRTARIQAGLTLQAVADFIGTSNAYIAQLEAGRTLPAPEKIPPLAECLRIPVAELQMLEAVERGRIQLPPGASPEAVAKAIACLADEAPAAPPVDIHAFKCPKCGTKLRVVE
jgi:transcriptional regulator with XRE-family HTH domain